MAPQGSRKGNDTLTNTTYKVGDKVQILDASRILYASQYLNDGDITTVKKVSTDGSRPTLNVIGSGGHEGGLYIMTKELPFIKKMSSMAPATSKASYKVGDEVRVWNASRIMFGSQYFADGDITTVVGLEYDGRPRLKTKSSDAYGLVILDNELPYIEKVVQYEVTPTKREAKIEAHGYKAGDHMRIIAAGKIGGGHRLTTGSVYEVDGISSYGNPRITCDDGTQLAIVASELPYVAKATVPVMPTMSKPTVDTRVSVLESQVTRVSELESQVASLEAKVLALESYIIEPMPTPPSLGNKLSSRYPSAPIALTRAEVIEQAKQFVEDVTERMDSAACNHEGSAIYRHYTTKPYFTTNGRKVTVVVRGSGLQTEYARASAICAEGDVFNEDIGRAIALGRALELTIPAAFTKAPQPTEVVVGMEVDTYYADWVTKNTWCPTTVTSLRGDLPEFSNGSFSSHYKITDDTNAQYGTGAF